MDDIEKLTDTFTALGRLEEDSIGFRLQFFCKKCKCILSPNKLVQGCPKCQNEIDLLLV